MSDGSISRGQYILRVAKPAAQTRNGLRALLPATGRHHTSKVRPEADVIALQQFVHNLFHHRNIPSGWAERQKKRVLVIRVSAATWAGVLPGQHRSSIPRPSWHQSTGVCYRHPSHGQSLPVPFLTHIFCPWHSSRPLTCT